MSAKRTKHSSTSSPSRPKLVCEAIEDAKSSDVCEQAQKSKSRYSINVRFGALGPYRTFLDWKVPAKEVSAEDIREQELGIKRAMGRKAAQATATRTATGSLPASRSTKNSGQDDRLEMQRRGWASFRIMSSLGRYHLPTSVGQANALWEKFNKVFKDEDEQDVDMS